MKKNNNNKPVIGILSMQRIINYGSFLQALGLKLMLNELGYEVVFVDFSIGKRFSMDNLRNTLIYKKARHILSFVKPGQENQMQEAIACEYEVLGLDRRYHYRRKVDVLIIGSDEVFNFIQNEKTVGCSPELLGVGNKAKKVLSYAASCGNLTEKTISDHGMLELFSESIGKFSAISVRDEKTAKLVEKYTGKSSFLHLDPVLTADYKDLPVDRVELKDYILVYGYSGRFTKEEGAAIQALAGRLGKKLYSLSEKHSFCDDTIYCRPTEVFAYFKHADFIITETFHGVVFSLITEKNFAVFVRSGEKGNENKLGFILEQFGVSDKRILSPDRIEEVLKVPVDFEKIRKIRNRERKRSLDYLKLNITQSGNSCCGCSACVQICPNRAITMIKDKYGFLYPEIDGEKCVLCGKCIEACNYQKASVLYQPLRVYAAMAKSEAVLQTSASGGVFPVLAHKVLSQNGIVYGCAFEYGEYNVSARHIRVDNEQELIRLSGSKYVQSETGDTFALAKSDLESGKLVLFSGTPCQIDGLKGFLGKEYDKLVTVDIVCHGVPSQLFFDGYIKSIIRKKGRVVDFHFRSKNLGWGENGQYTCSMQGGSLHVYNLYTNNSSYYKMFQNGDIFRASCYSCKYSQPFRCGDITVGDFWGIEEEHPELSDVGNKGISCVFFNTDKALSMFSDLDRELNMYPSALNKVAKHNEQLSKPSRPGKRRKKIMRIFNKRGYSGVERYMNIVLIKTRIMKKISRYI